MLAARLSGSAQPLAANQSRWLRSLDDRLVSYQIASLAKAGVQRVLLSCAAGFGDVFARELNGVPVEVVPVEGPEPLGRDGGLRHAAAARRTTGDVYALNGDELLPIDFGGLLARHRKAAALATARSPFGVVELAAGDVVHRLRRTRPSRLVGELRHIGAERASAASASGTR